MAENNVIIQTHLPQDVVNIMIQHLEQYDAYLKPASILRSQPSIEQDRRSTQVAWIQQENWIAAFVDYYIRLANDLNFKYDINNLDGGQMQYTVYNQGDHYGWHTDSGLTELYANKKYPAWRETNLSDYITPKAEYTRKLSFSLQLSDPNTYTGGHLQLLPPNDQLTTANLDLGSLIIFDSRTKHRVTKIKSGQRKSLVGWIIGPRWK